MVKSGFLAMLPGFGGDEPETGSSNNNNDDNTTMPEEGAEPAVVVTEDSVPAVDPAVVTDEEAGQVEVETEMAKSDAEEPLSATRSAELKLPPPEENNNRIVVETVEEDSDSDSEHGDQLEEPEEPVVREDKGPEKDEELGNDQKAIVVAPEPIAVVPASDAEEPGSDTTSKEMGGSDDVVAQKDQEPVDIVDQAATPVAGLEDKLEPQPQEPSTKDAQLEPEPEKTSEPETKPNLEPESEAPPAATKENTQPDVEEGKVESSGATEEEQDPEKGVKNEEQEQPAPSVEQISGPSEEGKGADSSIEQDAEKGVEREHQESATPPSIEHIPVSVKTDRPQEGKEASVLKEEQDPEKGIRSEEPGSSTPSTTDSDIELDMFSYEDDFMDRDYIRSKWRMTKERKTKILLAFIGVLAFVVVLAAIVHPGPEEEKSSATEEMPLAEPAPASWTLVAGDLVPTNAPNVAGPNPSPMQSIQGMPTHVDVLPPTDPPTRPLLEPDRHSPTTAAPTFQAEATTNETPTDPPTKRPTQAESVPVPPTITTVVNTRPPTRAPVAGGRPPDVITSRPLGSRPTNRPTNRPTLSPTPGPTRAPQQQMAPSAPVDENYIVSLLPDYTIDAMGDLFSPQSKALAWMLNDTLFLPHYSGDRILQRFALATFFFSTNGPFWARNDNWLAHDVHECMWFYLGPYDGYVGTSDVGGNHDNPCQLLTFGTGPLRPNGGVFRHLALWQNDLDGMIPPEIALLSRLRSIDLNGNQMKGVIPPEVSSLTDLKVLALGGNAFFGTLPNLSGIAKLETLMLSYNYLTGTIPTTLGRLTDLRYLLFDGNAFISGTIPTELSRLSNMEYLYLSGTSLQGAIPSQLGELTKVRQLDLWNNFLVGSIPTEIGRLTLMEWPSWDGNAFTGTIPTELGMWTNLLNFDLYDTEIGGPIPSEFGRFTNMEWYLVLANNNLSGTIPSELGLIPVSHLYLHGNQLTGTVPNEVCYVNDTVFDCSAKLCGCDCGCFSTSQGQMTLEVPSYEDIYHPYFGVLLNVRNGTV